MPPEQKTLAEMKAELEDLRRKLHRFKDVKEENRRLRQDLERLAEWPDRWRQGTVEPQKVEAWRQLEKDRNEERCRGPAESSNDLVTVVDWKGRFLYLNHRSRELLGIAPEQGLGLSAFEFVHPDDRDRTREWFTRQVDAGQDFGEIENRQVSPAGEVRHLVWTSRFHYDETGELTHVSGIARDITESKKAEQALEKSGPVSRPFSTAPPRSSS